MCSKSTPPTLTKLINATIYPHFTARVLRLGGLSPLTNRQLPEERQRWGCSQVCVTLVFVLRAMTLTDPEKRQSQVLGVGLLQVGETETKGNHT